VFSHPRSLDAYFKEIFLVTMYMHYPKFDLLFLAEITRFIIKLIREILVSFN